ncbi:5-formyltetrahydrofolate cyclo-ligase [Buchnera aphidicola (Neophyllaphis podocarpi)]|uniref:5-formyltetrahydrofolate cyclo-ligase n=1 Tax=Buchnera aphidicola TaxID=9 RepID=UPI0031B81ADC
MFIKTKSPKNIRKYIRHLRNNITKKQRFFFSTEISNHIFSYGIVKSNFNVGIFLSFDGEIDTFTLIKNLLLNSNNVYVPKILSFKEKKIIFMRYYSNTRLLINKFNIKEPFYKRSASVDIFQLKIIFVPLVAFNKKGNRLGFGQGFYDRLLYNYNLYDVIPIGLAYDFQLVDNFPVYDWDIRLPYVLTPSKLWIF